jgi:hypothetical protein
MAETGEAQWSEEVIEHPATNIDVPDVKLFGKWSLNDVEVNDISLQVLGTTRTSPTLHSNC